MKILWVSAAPWVRSAYGIQTDLITDMMTKDGHDVTIMAFAGLSGGPVQYGARTVVPLVDKLLHESIAYWIAALSPDVVITMLDMWTLERFVPPDGLPWIAYVPVDTFPVSPRLLAKIEAVPNCIPVSFSQWGARQAASAGVPMRAIPFGVGFPPLCDREKGLKTLGITDSSLIVVGIIADNNTDPSRKALVEQVQAFAQAKKTYPGLVLYCHTSPYIDRGGIDLTTVARTAGLSCGWAGGDERADMLFAHPARLSAGGYDAEYMSRAWDAIDVLLSCSASEGFCIPVLEASVRGIPAVVTSYFGLPDIALHGYVVDAPHCRGVYRARTESCWMFPEIRAIAARLMQAIDAVPEGDARLPVPDDYAHIWTPREVYWRHWKPLLNDIP